MLNTLQANDLSAVRSGRSNISIERSDSAADRPACHLHQTDTNFSRLRHCFSIHTNRTLQRAIAVMPAHIRPIRRIRPIGDSRGSVRHPERQANGGPALPLVPPYISSHGFDGSVRMICFDMSKTYFFDRRHTMLYHIVVAQSRMKS